MQLIQVDHVGPEPTEGSLDRVADVVGSGIVREWIATVRSHDQTRFRRQHRPVAAVPERTSDQLLVREGTVDVGGVQQGRSQIQRAVDDLDGLGLGRVSDVGPVHRHAAQPDLPDRQPARSERSRVHAVPDRATGRTTRTSRELSSGARNASSRAPSSVRSDVVALRQSDDRLDRQRGAFALHPPSAADETIHQERAEAPGDAGVDEPPAHVADHACPILVAEQGVVVLGKEPRRGRCVGVRPLGVGEVEQLPSGLVVEDAETRPEPFDHRTELGQSAPGLDVHHRRRSVSAEVPQDHVLDGWVVIERAPEPRLGGRPRGLSARAPHPSWRHLYHGQQVPDRGERIAVVIGPSLGEQRTELGARSWPFLDELADHRYQRADVDTVEGSAERTPRPEHALDDGVHQRTQPAHVARGDQMDRRPHQGGSNRAPRGDQVGKLLGLEAFQPRPQPHVRVDRDLGLHPDEPFDRAGGRERCSFEQHLPCQRRAVERSRAEHVTRHASNLTASEPIAELRCADVRPV